MKRMKTLSGLPRVRLNQTPEGAAKDFRAIAHVFIDDAEGQPMYMDSYPLPTANIKEARKVFKSLGYFVDKPFVHVYVDDMANFLHGTGTMSPEQFQEWTGLDIITWIWKLGPYPDYIMYHMGARPGIGLPVEWSEEWSREQASHQARARNLYESIEKSIYKNRDRITNLGWSISYDVAKRIRKPDEQNNIFMWVIEALMESDIDAYK